MKGCSTIAPKGAQVDQRVAGGGGRAAGGEEREREMRRGRRWPSAPDPLTAEEGVSSRR